jgi:hypothetical protein
LHPYRVSPAPGRRFESVGGAHLIYADNIVGIISPSPGWGEALVTTTMNERNNVMPDKSMKELVDEHGGYFACAFTTERGVKCSNVMVRAADAKEARSKIEKIMRCALACFAVTAYVY